MEHQMEHDRKSSQWLKAGFSGPVMLEILQDGAKTRLLQRPKAQGGVFMIK